MREKKIRSETTKVFLVIFFVLAIVGTLTVYSTFRGEGAFKRVHGVYLKQFQSVVVMKQSALDVISIYYALAIGQERDLLMAQLKRYDDLVARHEEAQTRLRATASHPEILSRLEKTKAVFDELNKTCRSMSISLLAGNKQKARPFFAKLDADVKVFKALLDETESLAGKQLNEESARAQALLKNSMFLGSLLTFLAIFITLGLIYYFIKLLRVSLLPISNLMHNMRQAVFSIDRKHVIIPPVSKYSSQVFQGEIVGENFLDVAYCGLDATGETFARAKSALIAAFGEDDVQWLLAEDSFPTYVKRRFTNRGTADAVEKVLKLTYTPLWDEQGKLQNIMIVAEDVTEVEKLRAEALRNQDELSFIQGLLGPSRSELQEFLVEARLHVEECRRLGQKSDQASRLLLFRILHTLKVNSRMHKLNAISESVHMTENLVVELNRLLTANEPVPSELTIGYEARLEEIGQIVTKYAHLSEKLAGMNGESASAAPANEFMPVKAVCSRMNALVADIARRLGKDVELIVKGDDLTLPRNQAHALRDVLGHLIRNSLDHGIEAPSQRLESGKPAKGKIEITCRAMNGHFELAVKDDGRGINVNKVITRAIALGRLTRQGADKLTPDERLALIFIPNLSTKDSVTDFSGRGIGMDVVKVAIEDMGGVITLSSSADAGTVTRILLNVGNHALRPETSAA